MISKETGGDDRRVLRLKGGPKGGTKKTGRKKHNEKKVLALSQDSALEEARKAAGGGKTREFKLPKDWKQKMCSACGMLFHKSSDCFFNPDNKKRPESLEPLSKEELSKKKASAIERYEALAKA